jgi:hypothetical protein
MINLKLGSVPSWMMYVILAVLIGMLSIAFVSRSIGPDESPELNALKAANSIVLYANALSGMEEGFARIKLNGSHEVRVEYIDKGFFKDVLEAALFFIDFKRDGYYLTVTPYRGGENCRSSSVFILSYPQNESMNLGNQFGRPDQICVTKESGRGLAEVRVC